MIGEGYNFSKKGFLCSLDKQLAANYDYWEKVTIVRLFILVQKWTEIQIEDTGLKAQCRPVWFKKT